MTSHTACHRDSISMLTNVDHWSRFNMCCILITSQLNCAFYCRSVSVCVYLLDWEVLRGLPMYFRMGFLFLSSPSFSFSFLVPLSCRKKKPKTKININSCLFHGCVAASTLTFLAFRKSSHFSFSVLWPGKTLESLSLMPEWRRYRRTAQARGELKWTKKAGDGYRTVMNDMTIKGEEQEKRSGNKEGKCCKNLNVYLLSSSCFDLNRKKTQMWKQQP